MLAIENARPTRRLVTTHHWGALVVELSPVGVTFRRPRCRTRVIVGWGSIYLLACDKHGVARARRPKKGATKKTR